MIDQLGYLAFEVSDLAGCETFATNVLGLEVSSRSDGGFALAMDSHAARFFVTQGPADDLVAIGWQVADEAALERVCARLPDAREGTPEEAAARGVVRLIVAQDPAGTRVEVYFGPSKRDAKSKFIADDLGLGHLVVSAPDRDAMQRFYDQLGFRASDRIVCEFYGYPVDITFLHTNARHHSVAFGGPQPKRLHHFLLEVRTIDEVGAALDRAAFGGVKIAQSIGRHPNDKMISFYAHTPSGFQFEYGCSGRLIAEPWQPAQYDRISEWGHHPPERYVQKRR